MENTRKVQLTGTTTLSVSLPKEWTKRYGVNRGTKLDVLEANDGSLIVSAVKRKQEKNQAVLTVEPESDTDQVVRNFLALYLAGSDSIKISSNQKLSAEIRRALIGETRRLIGLEATEESADEIIVQDFFSHEGLSISKTLNRTHLITCNIYEDLLKALKENDKALAQNTLSRDDEVDRLRFLLLRQLNLALSDASLLRKLDLNASECVNYAIVARAIEHIADKLAKISKNFAETPPGNKSKTVLKKIVQLAQDAFAEYELAFKSFVTGNTQEANKVIENKKGLLEKRYALEKELFKQSKVPFQYSIIIDTIAGIADDCSEIAVTTINQSTENKR
ncbi:MAG: PhoU domain-containing protein [Candidatus Micrarchaeia archaeon]